MCLASLPRRSRLRAATSIIGGVLAVTIAMNLLGFCYSALIAPIGRDVFVVSPTLTGMLAGAEAFGALLGGLWLTGRGPRLSGRTLMVGGSLLFLVCVILMPFAPTFALACALLVVGGIRLRSVRQHADVADRAACATAYPLAADGIADGLHRHGPAGHIADRRAGRPVRAAAGGGHHGTDRPGRGQRDRHRVAAQRPATGGRHIDPGWPRKTDLCQPPGNATLREDDFHARRQRRSAVSLRYPRRRFHPVRGRTFLHRGARLARRRGGEDREPEDRRSGPPAAPGQAGRRSVLLPGVQCQQEVDHAST